MLLRSESCLDFPSRRRGSTACAMALQILLVVAPATDYVADLFRPPFTDGSRHSPADFTLAAMFFYELMRRTLLPRMGYRETATHI
jgi:hypothetical protein